MNLALRGVSAGFAGALLLAGIAGAASAHVAMVGGHGGMGMGNFSHAGIALPGVVYAGHPGHDHMAHDHDHFRHGRFFLGIGGYPYAYDYGYGGGCGTYRLRARETGSAYWWRRYRDCLYG